MATKHLQYNEYGDLFDLIPKTYSKSKKYISTGIIEAYQAERNQNWLDGNPPVNDETRLATIEWFKRHESNQKI